MQSSLDRRRDHRTKQQFLADIAFGTAREERLMKSWAQQVSSQGAHCDYTPYAKGRDGGFLSQSSGDPDYRVTIKDFDLLPDGDYLLEIKYTPCLWKATFKIADMRAYIKQQSHMLLIFGDGVENPVKWVVLSPDQLERVVAEHQVSQFHPGMGLKPAVLVMEKEFKDYFGELKDWAHTDN